MIPAPLASSLAPAKINLHLRVGATDASGFHPLRSWMVTTSLTDRLDVMPNAPCRLSCDDSSVPTDRTNLVLRAADAIAPGAPVSFRLSKRIPAGAGLGGGSSDAATTLRALNDLLRLAKTSQELHQLAGTLGSDVPFFLGPAASAIATGRGEILDPTPPPAMARFALLLLPPYGVSTVACYRELDRVRPVAPADVLAPFDAEAWSELSAVQLLPRLVNDLEPPAFSLEPRLKSLQADTERRLGRPVRMSGSGSTLFTLFDSLAEADGAADRMKRPDFPSVRAETVVLAPTSGEIRFSG